MDDIRIIGAGLAGLLAACRWPDAQIIEARAPYGGPNHKALLRFRSDAVSKLTGIPFRQVRVDKGIWDGEKHHRECNIGFANAYAKKVLNKFAGSRSIWNLSTDHRWVAPHDFEQQLIDRMNVSNRIEWNTPVWTGDFTKGATNITISTMPMDKLLDKITHNYPIENLFKFDHSSIFVRRYKLPESTDLFQTLYFVDESCPIYRASITGNILIIEETQNHWDCSWSGNGDETLSEKDDSHFRNTLKAFGIEGLANWEVEFIDSKFQSYGKIVDMPKIDRESIMYELTREYNVYSLGRFATWRNVLLDDLVHDMDFINRLITSSAYQRHQIVNRAATPDPDWLNEPLI